MWIGTILLCFILFGLFMGACGILGWLLELIV
jgi:hypothetical protein